MDGVVEDVSIEVVLQMELHGGHDRVEQLRSHCFRDLAEAAS